MILSILGAATVGIILLWFTFWFFGVHFMAVAFAGWSSLKGGWYLSITYLAILVFTWWAYISLLAHSFDIHIKVT